MYSTIGFEHRDAEAIDQEVVDAYNREMKQESTARKAPGGLPKANPIAALISDTESQVVFANSGPPGRTFQKCEIKPAEKNEDGHADGNQKRTLLGKIIG